MINAVFNFATAVFPWMRVERKEKAVDVAISADQRIAMYGRYMRAYRGLAIRGLTTNVTAMETKRIRFNFNRPVVTLAAAWMAGKPVIWHIDGDTNGEAAAKAKKIWERSGAESSLIEACLLAGILGDIVGSVVWNESSRTAKIEFIDPTLCSPQFDPHKFGQLKKLTLGYETINSDGKPVGYAEDWFEDRMIATTEGEPTKEYSYDIFGGELPLVWIPNQGVFGQTFGDSELVGIIDLVEEYDHLGDKRTRIVDYYASPRPVFEGVQKGNLDLKDNSIIYLPIGGKAYFLEWAGSGPDIQQQLDCLRTAISEISETPAVAFGQVDSGFSGASGISLRVLYGPLNAKTLRKRATWGPRLEKLMQLALRAEGMEVALEDINIQWGDMTPASDLEALQVLQAKSALGVDKETILGEAGYTADQIAEMEEPPEEAPGEQTESPEDDDNGNPTEPIAGRNSEPDPSASKRGEPNPSQSRLRGRGQSQRPGISNTSRKTA
jgi:hypothetical protein